MSITKSFRNRIVGILVVVSVVLILLPFLNMNGKDTPKAQDDNAIAINQNGAVTDTNGQLVTAGNSDSVETNYSDMLEAPIDDTKVSSVSALSNQQKEAPASSPFDALNNNQTGSASVSGQSVSDLDVPNDNMFANANLETATPTGAKNTAKSNTVALPSANNNTATPSAPKQNSAKTETLRSSRVQSAQNNTTDKNKVNAHTAVNTATRSTNLVTGTFAAQIGVFSQKSYVTENVSKLKKAGFNVQTQSVNINGKSMVRVFAGTSKTRQGADAICRSAKAKVGLDCRILSL